ncbi:hypothetical protein RO3G_06444 [Lichtheimia corymbifera JMRC:FSU:9682]|uniref:FHA domain-containing protein n=1 Tax=Lichtheimia corymbifera JMRC:FSU:9682 TaxID=1263082 RepID=A0A068S0R5_9FUNG|nr:hypothetical protein RO3G_06444 [Lichtheimia corymbifera JMRC:FSU:9682]
MSGSLHSFSQSELRLLTASGDDRVIVNTPDVPPESASTYPKLVGSNWDCYITTNSIVLGRSPGSDTTVQRQAHSNKVDIDFGPDRRDISRRHAEIRFHRDKWILRIYGRNGAKVNHVLRKPKSPPVTLSNGSLIEIVDHAFVFILPMKPSTPAASNNSINNHTMSGSLNSSGSNTPQDHGSSSRQGGDHEGPIVLREFDQDGRLETMIAEMLRMSTNRDTETVVNSVLEKNPNHDKSAILHALVLSDKFQLVDNQWSLVVREPGVEENEVYAIQGPSFGTSIMDIYTTWLDARELANSRVDAATPASSSTISASTSRRSHGHGTPREGIKRQRSELVFVDPWKDVRTMDLLPVSSRR